MSSSLARLIESTLLVTASNEFSGGAFTVVLLDVAVSSVQPEPG